MAASQLCLVLSPIATLLRNQTTNWNGDDDGHMCMVEAAVADRA
jgi:hypothetical protein